MKNDTTDTCGQALSRMKNLFSKETKEHSEAKMDGSARAYDYLKLPRILAAKNKLFGGTKRGKEEWSKKHVSCTGTSHCSLSPKYLMHLLLELKSLEKNRNVKKLYLKEHLLAKRNFKNMGLKMNQWMTSYLSHKIKLIPEENPQAKEDIPWEDYIKQKEERQFLVTRVIKYLLD